MCELRCAIPNTHSTWRSRALIELRGAQLTLRRATKISWVGMRIAGLEQRGGVTLGSGGGFILGRRLRSGGGVIVKWEVGSCWGPTTNNMS